MGLALEKSYPFIIAGAATIYYYFFLREYPVPETMNSIFLSVINISAIFIGFLMTSKSILFSLHGRDVRTIEWIKGVNLYQSLIDYMMTAIHLCFFLAIYSAACLLSKSCIEPYYYTHMLGFWSFLIIAAVLSCYRVIHIFSKILRSM